MSLNNSHLENMLSKFKNQNWKPEIYNKSVVRSTVDLSKEKENIGSFKEKFT